MPVCKREDGKVGVPFVWHEIYKLSNVTGWDKDIHPTITIHNYESGWEEAVNRWRDGKNPTDSHEWKKGIIAHFKPDFPCVEIVANGIVLGVLRDNQFFARHISEDVAYELGLHLDSNDRALTNISIYG